MTTSAKRKKAIQKKDDLNLSAAPIELDENALSVLEKRYLKKDEKGNPVEKPQDLFYRVAQNIAEADKKYDKDADVSALAKEFYDLMAQMIFLPNSPTLMNAGRQLQQLSACFVLPIEDSMDSIFETLKNTALIHKSGGGTGFSFSRLRPKNDTVKTTSGVSSGPVSFMHVFNAATEAIKQGGTRRGANMAILRVDHPDILEFITCKDKNESLNNFNISVAVTDAFMEALKNNDYYQLLNPRTNQFAGKLKAQEVFDKIVLQAWKNGEPGIVFIDRMNAQNPTPTLEKIYSTNPCGEQPLLAYESCNLGSINLGKFVKDGKILWDDIGVAVKIAVHFLDNVIDANRYPLAQIGKVTRSNRKVGLGVMGWADMLLYLGIPYGSEQSIELAQKLMQFISQKAQETSQELAQKRGAFENFKNSIFAQGKPIRNATLTTIAPTGTIGIIAGASGGIEPIFAIAYKRMQCLDGQDMHIVHPYFEKIAKENGFYSKELMEKIAKSGSVKDIEEVPQKFRDIFVTSHDITPSQHIKMQAAFQKYVDNAVSKTVNFANSATQEDVKEVYMLSYEMGCKGVTVYRDGSRNIQVLAHQKEESPQAVSQEKKRPRIRPSRTAGYTYLMATGCQKLYLTINEDAKGPCEVFVQLGKSGGCPTSNVEAIGRLVSIALRSNVELDAIIEQLKGIRCPMPAMAEGGVILSCADAVAKALELYKRDKQMPGLFEQSAVLNSIEHPKFLDVKTDNFTAAYQNANTAGVCPQCPECGMMLSF
ncbi:MAG: vitamin B12-dependent ribonucleotide reductase, partial [Elusimicrobiota bacterium]|nr:vitamin B12-dependent ribonucleotide reductase [Elusimicrobiota bacterium]